MNSPLHGRFTRGAVGGALLALCVVLLPCLAVSPATAQDAPAATKKYRSFLDPPFARYIDKKMFTDRSYRNSRRFVVMGVCRGTKQLSENQDDFDAFFKKFYFPAMTDPAQLGNVATLRQDFFKQYYETVKSDQLRDHMNRMTLPFMRGLAKGDFHPAVRFNAMLMIGDLDSRGPILFGDAKPSEPWPEALDILLEELVTPTQIDAVRVACLIGIRRHAELDRFLPADRRMTTAGMRLVIDRVLPIAAMRDAPGQRTHAGHTWMRRIAIEILGDLGTAGPGGNVAKLLDEIVSDENEPMSLRLAAAEAQGKLGASAVLPEVGPAQAVRKLGVLGVQAVSSELAAIKPFAEELKIQHEEQSRGRPGIFGRPDITARPDIIGGDAGGDEPEEIVVDKAPPVLGLERRLRTYMAGLQRGLVGRDGSGGIGEAAKSGEPKKLLDDILAAIKDIVSELETAPGKGPELAVELEAFSARLAQKGVALRDMVGKPADPSAPADGPTAGPGPGPSSGPPGPGS